MKWINYIYTYIPSFLDLSHIPHPAHLGHHRASSWALSAIEWVPTASNLHRAVYIYKCYSLNLSLPLCSALCSQICSLHLHLCPALKINSKVTFLILDADRKRKNKQQTNKNTIVNAFSYFKYIYIYIFICLMISY